MNEKEFKKHLQGILAENRENNRHPKPPKQIKCGKCNLREPRALKCHLYPEGIPRDIVTETIVCPEFEEMQQK